MKKIFLYLCIGSSFIPNLYANTRNDPHLPISHCYHWLDSNAGYLDYKYDYANQNNGALTFFTTAATSNGSIAGPGLYCAKSPSGSYSYGDRVIRIDFSDDVVLLDEYTGKKHCGHNGKFYADQAECDSKDWDVKFYSGGGVGSTAWYVISNPNAITSWSATSDQLISDLELSKTLNGYSFQSHADSTLSKIYQDKANHPDITYNSDARIGLISMLEKKPELLKTIPRMHLLKALTSNAIPDNLKAKVQEVKENVISEIIHDELLAMSDYEDLFKNPAITQAVLSQTFKNIQNSNRINISLMNVFMKDYVQKVSSEVDKDYMKMIFNWHFINHPNKINETIDFVESIGGFFEDSNRKAYKEVFEDSFDSILKSMKTFPEQSFERIVEYIGFNELMEDDYLSFRRSLLKLEQDNIAALADEDKVMISNGGKDYFISKISEKEMHRSCKLTLFSLTNPRKILAHTERGPINVKRRKMRGLKDIDIMCDTLSVQFQKLEYQAMCSTYNGDNYNSAGMVSGRNPEEIIENCKDMLTTQKMQISMMRLKDFKSVITGKTPRYSADCHVDDDNSFDAYQMIIGRIYGNDFTQLNNDCKDFASVYSPSNHSSALLNIELNREASENVSASCLIDFKNKFNDKPVMELTVYGEETLDAMNECELMKDIMETSFYRGHFSFVLDNISYKKDLASKAVCHIEAKESFQYDHEFEIQAKDPTELDQLCTKSKVELYGTDAKSSLK